MTAPHGPSPSSELPLPLAARHAARRQDAQSRVAPAAPELVLWIAGANVMLPYGVSDEPVEAGLTAFHEIIRSLNGRGGPLEWSILYLPPLDIRGRAMDSPRVLAAGYSEPDLASLLAGIGLRLGDRHDRKSTEDRPDAD